MVRRTNKPAPIVDDNDDETAPASAPDPAIDGASAADDDTDLSAYLLEAQEGADVQVSIYRVVNPGRRQAFLLHCNAFEFSRERLRDEFGGGDFRIYVKRDKKLVATKNLLIEPPRSAPVARQQSAVAPELLHTLQSMQAAIEALAQRAAVPPVDNEEIFLRRLAMYKQILGGAESAPPAFDPMKQFEIFQKGLEFAKQFAGEVSDKSNIDVLLESIRTFGKPIAALVLRGAQQKATAPRPQPRPAGASPAAQLSQQPPAQPPAPTQGEDMNAVNAMLTEQFAWLCDQAEANADPALYGDLILDQVPEEQLRAFVTEGDAYQKVLALQPRVGLQEAWFRELLAHVTNGLNEESASDVPLASNADDDNAA